MYYSDEIFERVSFRGIVNSLLYNNDSVQKEKNDYGQRMKNAFQRFEEKTKQYEQNVAFDLMDDANELVSKTQEIYMEIGLQSGIMLAMEMLENTNLKKKSMVNQNNIDHIDIYQFLYNDISFVLKELKGSNEVQIEKLEISLKAIQHRLNRILTSL